MLWERRMTSVATCCPAANEGLDSLRASFQDFASGRDGVLTIARASSDLPDLLDAFAATTADAFYWQQPSQGLAMLALGAACSIRPEASDRFAAAADWWRERVNSAGSPPGFEAESLAVGGFAFAPQLTQSDPVWSGWPRNLWVAPALVLERRGGDTSVQLQATDLAGVQQALALAAQALGACPAAPPPQPAISMRDDPGHDWWDASVDAVLAAITDGSMRKQVLARRIRAHASAPIDAATVLRRLCDRFPGATIYAVRRGGRCFLGASPEELVGLHDGTIAAAALAGTSQGRDGTPLLSDAKELLEHAFVVDALRERLAPHCDQLDVPAGPQLMTLPNFAHLYTPLRGHLAEARGLLELIADLHPTPAVGAVPQAGDRSTELEPFDRGWYAGPIAWARGEREGDAVVALRCALVDGDRAVLYAGCGILQGSDPEREWREARLKMEALCFALGSHEAAAMAAGD
jgi:menaquinone-specific isochorismate synthase